METDALKLPGELSMEEAEMETAQFVNLELLQIATRKVLKDDVVLDNGEISWRERNCDESER